MAIGTPTQRTAGTSDTDATAYSTASHSPAANALLVVALLNSRGSAPTAPTIGTTGLSLGAFTAIDTIKTPNDIARVTVWWCATGASPGTGTIDFSFGGTTQTGAQWVVWDITGADMTTPIVQHATNTTSGGTTCSVTLTSDTWALTGSFHGITGTDVVTVGSGFSALGNQSGSAPARRLRGQYQAAIDTSVEMTTSASVDWAAVAFGIAEAASSASPTDSDTGTLAESSTLTVTGTTVSDADSGTLVSAGTVAATVVDTDTGTATSGGGVESTTGIDSFVLAEDSTSLLIAETGPDGTLSEAYTLGAAIARTETATLTESGTVVVGALAVTASDTGTLGESSSLSSTFPGIVVDTSGTDTGTLAEAAYVAYPVANGTDSATLAEAASIAVGQSATPSDSDAGALQESTDQPAVLTVAETGLVTESGSVVVTVVADESATVDDILAALLADPFQATDTGALVEAAVAADETLMGAVRGSVALLPRLPGTADLGPRLAGTVVLTP